jgi:hypothetical protein
MFGVRGMMVIHARVHARSWIMVTVALVFDRILDRVRTVFSALTAQSSMCRPLWLVGHLYRWFSQWFNTVCVVNGQPCPGVGKNRPWWWLRFKEAAGTTFACFETLKGILYYLWPHYLWPPITPPPSMYYAQRLFL